MIQDDCDEVHGMADAKAFNAGGSSHHQTVTVTASGQWITLNKSEGTAYPATMTPRQARYLASKLYRVARIVQQRRDAASARGAAESAPAKK